MLLGGDRLIALFEQQGVAAIRQLLLEWARAFVAHVEPEACPHADELEFAKVWITQFPNSGRRLVVEVKTKVARDDLCSACGRSPARLSSWSDTTVRARLTVGEDSNRKKVLAAFQ